MLYKGCNLNLGFFYELIIKNYLKDISVVNVVGLVFE